MGSFEAFEEIRKEKENQTAMFIERVQERNKQEALLIATKYDLKHSLKEAVHKYPMDNNKMIQEFRTILQKRNEFLNLLVEYL